MKKDKKSIIIFTLIAVNLAVTVFIVICLFTPFDKQLNAEKQLVFEAVENGQYVLYIGTNDRYTYEQIIPTEQA